MLGAVIVPVLVILGDTNPLVSTIIENLLGLFMSWTVQLLIFGPKVLRILLDAVITDAQKNASTVAVSGHRVHPDTADAVFIEPTTAGTHIGERVPRGLCQEPTPAEAECIGKGHDLRVAFENSPVRRRMVSPWEGVEIEMVFIEGRSLGYLKSWGYVKAHPADIIEMRLDSLRWKSHGPFSVVLVDEPGHSQLVYTRIHMPLPLRPRDLLNLTTWTNMSEEEDTEFLIVAFPTVSDKVPLGSSGRDWIRGTSEEVITLTYDKEKGATLMSHITRVNVVGRIPIKVMNSRLIHCDQVHRCQRDFGTALVVPS
jgi:hypothetical protein